ENSERPGPLTARVFPAFGAWDETFALGLFPGRLPRSSDGVRFLGGSLCGFLGLGRRLFFRLSPRGALGAAVWVFFSSYTRRGGIFDSGTLFRAGPKQPFLLNVPRQGLSFPRGSRRPMIPSPLLRYALVAALAALAITWPGMVSARAQAEPRDGFSRTSPSGSYLAARHAGGQRDVAAAASYYRAALRDDPGNNELLGRTFVAVLAHCAGGPRGQP